MSIQSFCNKTAPELVATALLKKGGVIVLNAADDLVIDKVNSELRSPLETMGGEFENEFNGYKTRRVGTVLESSPASAELLTNPLALGVADASTLR